MRKNNTLAKSLKLHQVVFVGLAWMTPMIFFTVYGVAFQTSNGMLVPAYLIAFLAIFFTAYSYSRMSQVYPTSGSAYTYTKKTIHPQVGFLVGWALLLDYIFSPIIACLTFGLFLNAQFPVIPVYAWILILIAVLAIVNIIGIKSVAHVSSFSVVFQIVFMVLFCAITIKDIVSGSGGGALVSLQPFVNSDGSVSTIFAGAALICFCFLGFDAITTMGEETINPTKTIPRAIFIIIAIAATLYISTSYLTKIALPNFMFQNPDTASYELVKQIGGNSLSSLFIMVLIVAIFTQGVTSVTSITRFLYALGRESILPNKVFTYIHPRYQTPIVNVVLVSIVSLSALFIKLDMAVTFVSFGSLTAFIFVNLSVIAHYYVKQQRRSVKDTFQYLVFPLIGSGFIAWLLMLLNEQALVAGGIWMVCGIIYLLFRTNLFRKRLPEIKAEKMAEL